jgi:HD-GYP domain-containing protein (c-di-GMP phosphodiesterase class II)
VASILGTHQHNLELYRQHEDLLLSFVRSLVSTLDAKDAYTRGHSERVALVARRIGTYLGLPEEDLRNIYLSGLLHDIGKIGVDDQILRKPGQLTAEEFAQIKRHPVIGYNILAGLRNLQAVLPGVRHHHEAFSGTGYPDGLSGDEIPLMARILAVADSYDAMISDRPYRNGLKLERLEAILREGSGTQWDPRVVSAYFVIRDDVRAIWETYSPVRGGMLDGTLAELEKLADDRDPIRAIEGIRGALGGL